MCCDTDQSRCSKRLPLSEVVSQHIVWEGRGDNLRRAFNIGRMQSPCGPNMRLFITVFLQGLAPASQFAYASTQNDMAEHMAHRIALPHFLPFPSNIGPLSKLGEPKKPCRAPSVYCSKA